MNKALNISRRNTGGHESSRLGPLIRWQRQLPDVVEFVMRGRQGFLFDIEKRSLALLTLALAVLFLTASCSHKREAASAPAEDQAVVRAPIAGIIRAVLVAEDASVDQGTPILEIVVEPAPSSSATSGAGGQKNSDSDLAVAKVEVTRTEEKVKQIQQLVAKGYASRADLDEARAKYQDARARLERARSNSATVSEQTSREGAPSESTVAVLAPTSGKIHNLRAQVGQSVKVGDVLVAVLNQKS
jgi:biotin carboxyl carrier protein